MVWSVVGTLVIAKGVPSGPLTVHCQFGSVGVDDPHAMVPFTARVAVSPGTRLRKLGVDQGTMFTVQGTKASGDILDASEAVPASALPGLPPKPVAPPDAVPLEVGVLRAPPVAVMPPVAGIPPAAIVPPVAVSPPPGNAVPPVAMG